MISKYPRLGGSRDAKDREVISRVRKLIDLSPTLVSRLAEKGIECYIIAPALDAWFRADLIESVSYEVSSERRNDQRFDFVVDDVGVIEAKSLKGQISQYEEQIKEYLQDNPKYHYGVLTNGIDWEVWLNCSTSDDLRDCRIFAPIKVAHFDLRDEEKREKCVLALCKFRRETREDFLASLKNCVKRIKRGGMGPWPRHDHDRELNEFIQNAIPRQIEPRRTQYIQAIQREEIVPGTILTHHEDYAEVSIKVREDGSVSLALEGIKILDNARMARSWPNVFSVMEELTRTELSFDWCQNIAKRLTGRKRPRAWEFIPKVM